MQGGNRLELSLRHLTLLTLQQVTKIKDTAVEQPRAT